MARSFHTSSSAPSSVSSPASACSSPTSAKPRRAAVAAFPSRPLLLCSALLAASAAQAQTASGTTGATGAAGQGAPRSVFDTAAERPALVTVRSDDRHVFTATDSRPAAFEVNWTPIKMPNGDKTAFLGVSYMVAINEDWGLGPAAYGAAKGQYGGLFTVGFNLQRRFRLAQDWHMAASVYAGAGGGVSSAQVRPGGGLMVRPELSVRREFGNWYLGLGVAHTAFPNGTGNIKDTNVMLTVGRMDRFLSFDPSLSGRDGRAGDRTGMGFDEIAVSVGVEKPRGGSRTRDGVPLTGRRGKAGGDLRQYFGNGASWWGLEASGAASGGHDGYMEILANAGQDWGLGSERFRIGGQVSVGLGGGGNMDTGSGWLVRVGPTMRWITPWGPTLRLDAGYMKAPWGHYDSFQVRGSLALPLEKVSRMLASPPLEAGTIRAQSWYIAMPRFKEFVFKDGTRESVTGLGLGMARDFGGPWYGTAQAGSAALGKAGAFSYGMVGMGAHSPKWNGVRVGAEALVGAAGGGGVSVGGGAVTQGELWAQWEGTGQSDRLRVKLGVGQWKALGGDKHSTPLVSLNIGWAFGTLGPAKR